MPAGYQVYIQSSNMYYPYGYLQPGRHSQTAVTFRYGFQGQEKDNEIRGEGNSLNYKYRMHDARIGRFFALDTLSPDYPHNSPYAFSENRVIDGVELEGLEYVTYNILVIENKVVDIQVVKDYELKNKNNWGAGMQYNIINVDEDNNVSRQEIKLKNRPKRDYGIYGGTRNPKLPQIGKPIGNIKSFKDIQKSDYWEEVYDLEALDEWDENWKTHDINFENEDAKGALDTFFNYKTYDANIQVIDDVDEDLERAEKGEIDRSGEDFARRGKLFFKIVVGFQKVTGQANKSKNEK